MTLIDLNGISKTYDDEGLENRALCGIDLQIDAGEFVVVVGPSGGGKSTLLSILGLLEYQTLGTYHFGGTDVKALSSDQQASLRNEHIGFVFQAFNLIDELTVFQNVALPLQFKRPSKSGDDIATKVDDALNQVGMLKRKHHRPGQLSGGQQQLVAIARALVNQPKVLLLDEPTGNLDTSSGNRVMKLIESLHSHGHTVCMVTHDLGYADYAQRKIHIIDGKVVDVPVQVQF